MQCRAIGGVNHACLSCRYVVQCMLGQGTFGQVVECVREDHGHERLAVKVIKNQQAYFQQVLHCQRPTHCMPPALTVRSSSSWIAAQTGQLPWQQPDSWRTA